MPSSLMCPASIETRDTKVPVALLTSLPGPPRDPFLCSGDPALAALASERHDDAADGGAAVRCDDDCASARCR
jgi:hypothetical protein